MGCRGVIAILFSVLVLFSLSGCSGVGGLTGKTVLKCEGGVCYIDNTTLNPKNATPDNVEQLFENLTKPEDIGDTSGMLAITVNETGLVRIKPKAVDPDNDKLRYIFTAPLDEKGEWQTKIGDAGKYIVTLTVTDGQLSSSQKILIVVNPKNQAPVISSLSDITVNEGEKIVLTPQITDTDNDEVTVSYSGWMSLPEYTTTYEDAGTHTVTVTVTDSKATAAKSIKIVVLDINRLPVITLQDKIVATEKDLIKLDVKASDPDNDAVHITYPEPFTKTGEWQTKQGDAGVYRIKVAATDSKATVTAESIVEIKPLNTAPQITMADIVVNEGDTITLNPVITDPDGDNAAVSYSGWMNAAVRKTTYDDAGSYTVTITASDGKTSSAKAIRVTVNNVNRPPVIVGIES